MFGGKALAKRDERNDPSDCSCPINVWSGLKLNHRTKLRGLLTLPQRERLPCLKVWILAIGKIKPTISIRAEGRLIFSEIEFIECTPVVFADLNGYEILIGQPIDEQDFCGKLCHGDFKVAPFN
jgi:hypothetical protein